MNIEFEPALPEKSNPDKNPEKKSLKKRLEDGFKSFSGLNEDAINCFPMNIEDLRPAKRYIEYFTEKYPDYAKDILDKSSSEKIKDFNEIVDKFNAKLEELGRPGKIIDYDLKLIKLTELIKNASILVKQPQNK